MDRNHIAIGDNGSVIEITGKTMKLSPAPSPPARCIVDGSGVGDVGAVVMRDRKRLAEDGMVVVVLPIATQDGALLSPPGDHHPWIHLCEGIRRSDEGAAKRCHERR